MVYIGLILFGIFAGFMYVPLLAHMIDLATDEYEFENDDVLSDTLSGSINFFTSCGNLFGPIVGGFLVEYWSFENLFTLLGIVFLVYGLFFVGVHLRSTRSRKISLISSEDSEMNESK